MGFKANVNTDTGELSDKLVWSDGEWTFIRYEHNGKPYGRIKMYGSLHKHFEDGFNWSDFDVNALFYSVIDVCGRYGINPHLARFYKLEAGVNIKTEFPPSTLIQNAFSLKGRSQVYHDMNNNRHQPIGKELTGTDHRSKLYNKSGQLAAVQPNIQSSNILRYEDHYSRMRDISSHTGIYTLADLCKYTNLQHLTNEVVNNSQRLIFLNDKPSCEPFGKTDRTIISNWSNPTRTYQLKLSNPKKYSREMKRYLQLTTSNTENLSYQFRAGVKSKANQLLQTDQRMIKAAQIFLSQYQS